MSKETRRIFFSVSNSITAIMLMVFAMYFVWTGKFLFAFLSAFLAILLSIEDEVTRIRQNLERVK